MRAPLICVVALVLVTVAGPLPVAVGATTDDGVVVAGEVLAAPSAARTVVDRQAAGQRVLRLSAPARASASVVLPRAATGVVVRARAVACSRSALMRLAVDDGRAVAVAVHSKRFANARRALTIPAGRHRLTVTVQRPAQGCRRVRVDLDELRLTLMPAGAPTAVLASQPAGGLPALAVLPSAPSAAAAPAPLPAPVAVEPDPLPATDPPAATESGTDPAPDPNADPAPDPATDPAPDPGTDPAPDLTPDPGTDPAPEPDPTPQPTRPRLRWSPPTLTAPTTIAVAQGDVSLSLDPAKDYIIDLGSSMHLGGLVIAGGNDIIIMGGSIGLPSSSSRNAALSIKNSTGVVHVEGVWFDGSQGHEMDAIQIVAPQATVQVQNVRATGLIGSYETNHTDVIQPWGGVLALRVDRLTADTTYQGIFTRPDQGAIGSVTLQHVDLAYDDPGTTTGGYMLWMTTGCDMAPTTLTDVYVQPGPKRTLGNSVWPPTSDKSCPAVVSGGVATWPKLPVTGSVTAGAPPDGPFVGQGEAGLGYVSPGYA